MQVLDTMKSVRPISLPEIASALAILMTYLVALKFGAHWGASPLGLAIAMAIALRVFSNLLFLSPARRNLILNGPRWRASVAWLATAFVFGLGGAAALADDGGLALRVWCAMQLGVGVFNAWASRDMKLMADEAAAFGIRRGDVWAWNIAKAGELALVVTAALALHTFAGEIATLLCVSMGVPVMRVAGEWMLHLHMCRRRARGVLS